MHHTIDGRSGGHWILEDPVPLGEDQVAGDHDATALVALAEEGEEDLHFFAVLLDVPEVIEDDHVEAIEASQLLLQYQVPPRYEEALDELIGSLRPQTLVFATAVA